MEIVNVNVHILFLRYILDLIIISHDMQSLIFVYLTLLIHEAQLHYDS